MYTRTHASSHTHRCTPPHAPPPHTHTHIQTHTDSQPARRTERLREGRTWPWCGGRGRGRCAWGRWGSAGRARRPCGPLRCPPCRGAGWPGWRCSATPSTPRSTGGCRRRRCPRWSLRWACWWRWWCHQIWECVRRGSCWMSCVKMYPRPPSTNHTRTHVTVFFIVLSAVQGHLTTNTLTHAHPHHTHAHTHTHAPPTPTHTHPHPRPPTHPHTTTHTHTHTPTSHPPPTHTPAHPHTYTHTPPPPTHTHTRPRPTPHTCTQSKTCTRRLAFTTSKTPSSLNVIFTWPLIKTVQSANQRGRCRAWLTLKVGQRCPHLCISSTDGGLSMDWGRSRSSARSLGSRWICRISWKLLRAASDTSALRHSADVSMYSSSSDQARGKSPGTYTQVHNVYTHTGTQYLYIHNTYTQIGTQYLYTQLHNTYTHRYTILYIHTGTQYVHTGTRYLYNYTHRYTIWVHTWVTQPSRWHRVVISSIHPGDTEVWPHPLTLGWPHPLT